MLKTIIAAAALVIGAATAHAADYQAGAVKIEQPWARASAGPAANGGAFMTLTNAGAPDRLLKAASPVARIVELHTHLNEDGVMKMRPVPAIDLAAGAKVELKPGSFHVMLIGLHAPLKEGTQFPLTLTFEKAGTVEIQVAVQKPGAMGVMPQGMPGGMPQGGHGKTH